MVQYTDTLHDRITSIENKTTTLNTILSDTEHVLYSTSQDLSAIRAFISNHSNPVIGNIGLHNKSKTAPATRTNTTSMQLFSSFYMHSIVPRIT